MYLYVCVYLHIMCTLTLKDKLQKLILFPECGNGDQIQVILQA